MVYHTLLRERIVSRFNFISLDAGNAMEARLQDEEAEWLLDGSCFDSCSNYMF